MLTTPTAATVTFIRDHDRPFYDQTAGNNRACKRAPACQKRGVQ